MGVLTCLDIVVLAGYFLVVVAIGIAGARRVKNVQDYYMGGRRFGKAMMIMFAFGAGTHADSAVGLASQTYKLGMAGIWYQWSQLFNTPIYWLLSPIFRRGRCLTTGDLYEMRYGPWLGALYGVWGVAINMGFLSVTLFGSGKLIEALTGGALSLRTSVFLMTAAFIFYSLLGGMIATVWNEFFQGMLTIVMSVLLIPFLWHAVGGIAGFRAAVPGGERYFRMTAPGEIGSFWIAMVSLNQLMGFVAQPHIMSNNGAGRTELDNRVGFSAGVTLKRLCSVGWAMAGALAIAYYGVGRIQPDHVFGLLIRDLLPTGFVGLMLACVMASVMDVGSVLVLSTSALFTRNLLRRFRVREQSHHEIVIGRLFSLVYVGASIALALSFPDVPSAIRFMWGLLPMIGIAFWLGLWWRRANRYGAVASFAAATVAWYAGLNIFGWTGDRGLPYLITFYMLAGLGAGVVVSLFTAAEEKAQLDRFYLTINTPIGQESRLRQLDEAEALSKGAGEHASEAR
jgi:Na+/proline symporter